MLDSYVTIWIAVAVFNIILTFLLNFMHERLGLKASLKAWISILSSFIAMKIEKKSMASLKEVEKEKKT